MSTPSCCTRCPRFDCCHAAVIFPQATTWTSLYGAASDSHRCVQTKGAMVDCFFSYAIATLSWPHSRQHTEGAPAHIHHQLAVPHGWTSFWALGCTGILLSCRCCYSREYFLCAVRLHMSASCSREHKYSVKGGLQLHITISVKKLR